MPKAEKSFRGMSNAGSAISEYYSLIGDIFLLL